MLDLNNDGARFYMCRWSILVGYEPNTALWKVCVTEELEKLEGGAESGDERLAQPHLRIVAWDCAHG